MNNWNLRCITRSQQHLHSTPCGDHVRLNKKDTPLKPVYMTWFYRETNITGLIVFSYELIFSVLEAFLIKFLSVRCPFIEKCNNWCIILFCVPCSLIFSILSYLYCILCHWLFLYGTELSECHVRNQEVYDFYLFWALQKMMWNNDVAPHLLFPVDRILYWS